MRWPKKDEWLIGTIVLILGTTAAYLLLIPVNALAIPAILFAVAVAIVIMLYEVVYTAYKAKLPEIKLDPSVIVIFSVIIGAAAIFAYISVAVASVPINYVVEKFDGQNISGQNMTMLVTREPTILIPLKNAAPFPPRTTDIQASLYHNINTTIQAVRLSTNDSILSYPPNFTFVNSSLTEDVQRGDYKMGASAIHSLTANNVTEHYTIDVLFFNKTDGVPQNWSVPFSWPINTLNMNTYNYFWIVLVGVIISRVLSLVLDKLETIRNIQDPAQKDREKGQPIILDNEDYIWITFSFIIAILIFTGFTTQVQLTTSIILNISLAFAFGFGFDRVLEVAKKFQTIAT
jgi:hypothetical protein